MANEKRSRTNLAAGALTAGLSISDTTMSSPGLADLGVIDTTNHAAVTIFTADATGRITAKEIVYVTAHTTAATTATIARGKEGTSAAAWSTGATWAHTATAKDFDGAAGGAGLIGITSYNPASAATPSTTSSTFADVDATNLVVAFTGPPSGKVLVALSSRAGGNANTELSWNLRNGSSDVTGSKAVVAYDNGGSVQPRCHHRTLVTGLTAGTAYSFKWGFARSFGSGSAIMLYGGSNGEALMEVWAVNL